MRGEFSYDELRWVVGGDRRTVGGEKGERCEQEMLANHGVTDLLFDKAPDRTGNKQQEHQYTSSPYNLSCNICTTKAVHRMLRLFNNSSIILVLTVYPGSDGEELKRSKQSGKEKDESTDEWRRKKKGKSKSV